MELASGTDRGPRDADRQTALRVIPAGNLGSYENNKEAAARALSGGLIGSPETIRRKLRRFQTSNIDQVILLNQAGRNTHEHICESLELFATEVMPEFHAAEPEHMEWKAKVLSGEIQLEEIDTQPFRDRFGPNSVQPVAQAAE